MTWTKGQDYRGIHMRSGLEIAWAAFLDAQHIVWEYEPLTFARKSLRPYTPDFGLDGDCSVFLEVKHHGLPNNIGACPFPLIIVTGHPNAKPSFATFTKSAGLRVATDWTSALSAMRTT